MNTPWSECAVPYWISSYVSVSKDGLCRLYTPFTVIKATVHIVMELSSDKNKERRIRRYVRFYSRLRRPRGPTASLVVNRDEDHVRQPTDMPTDI